MHSLPKKTGHHAQAQAQAHKWTESNPVIAPGAVHSEEGSIPQNYF